MITYRDIALQVTESLCDYVNEFNVDGIVRDIIDQFGLVDISTIDEAEYWGLVEKHDYALMEQHAR